ncbi:hypothetical protein EV426DRAFT_712769 [Tirmania nivea]|nr:hypothetical protein EV426DRAFT_712769 [Tirmania nivea]
MAGKGGLVVGGVDCLQEGWQREGKAGKGRAGSSRRKGLVKEWAGGGRGGLVAVPPLLTPPIPALSILLYLRYRYYYTSARRAGGGRRGLAGTGHGRASRRVRKTGGGLLWKDWQGGGVRWLWYKGRTGGDWS